MSNFKNVFLAREIFPMIIISNYREKIEKKKINLPKLITAMKSRVVSNRLKSIIISKNNN